MAVARSLRVRRGGWGGLGLGATAVAAAGQVRVRLGTSLFYTKMNSGAICCAKPAAARWFSEERVGLVASLSSDGQRSPEPIR